MLSSHGRRTARRDGATAVLLALLALLWSGAAAAAGEAAGAWLAPAPALADPDDPLSLRAPETLLVVIFNHGSAPEFVPDPCAPRGETTPAVVAELAGARLGGRRVAVFAFCTPQRIGSYRAESRTGEPKVVARAAAIAQLAAGLRAAGVPARQIVLAGQSAGAWASLLAAARAPAAFGGVVAFAPAFAGAREGREPGWRVLRSRLRDRLLAAPRLPALVFAFAGDPYEAPADLAFLARVPGVELRALPDAPAGQAPCLAADPHLTAFLACFAARQRAPILDFLAARLAGGTS